MARPHSDEAASAFDVASSYELNLTWFSKFANLTLLPMQKRSIQRGRPAGTKTFDSVPAKAFGAAVAALRTEDGIAQETLALMTGIERSHMGKIERGLHAPTLVLILRIARALNRSAGELLLETEARLPSSWEQVESGAFTTTKAAE